ncbi:MAG TPA: bifunctional diguanylate cyclase/phosphodiesterase [Acidobacteriaceae bacterium]
MNNRATRFLSTDSGILTLLAVMTLLLALGAVKLSRMVAANMLRTNAQFTVSAWTAALLNSTDIPGLIAGTPSAPITRIFLESATPTGNIYRYAIWSRSGELVYSSTSTVPVSPIRRYGEEVGNGILSGWDHTETHRGTSPENPTYYADSFVPIRRNDETIGVIEAHLDLTAAVGLYERSFLITEGIIALGVLLAGGIPGLLVWRKMHAHRAAQAEAVFLSQHDNLTGIANRKSLEDRAEGALAWTRRNNGFIAALLIDMDRFKEVNDNFGHSVGDEVLKAFAVRLKDTIRTGDMVARLGGDEFVILQVGIGQPAGARSLAGRLIEVLSVPYQIGELQLICGASIGVAIAPTDSDNWESLLVCADVALYNAKVERGNAVAFFQTGMDASFRERRQLEQDLRRALTSNAFELAYQPLFSFHDQSLLGFEALLRWPQDWPPQSPATFIPVAEESGLIIPIGGWVLQAACRAAAAWTKPLRIAVNLSPVQFRNGDIVSVVEEALRLSGLDPTRLELEVTESLWIHNAESVLEQLARLRAMGITIALDDFGTGYSSLTYLWKFPFDVVKIDRTFVSGMKLDPKANAIVNTIVALGRTLDLTVTAEGVETTAQAQALKEVGCDQVQGFLYGRPVSGVSASALVDAGARSTPITAHLAATG